MKKDVIVLDINVEICAAQYENMFSSWSRVIFRRSDQSISLCFQSLFQLPRLPQATR